jgi:hypothetical protein
MPTRPHINFTATANQPILAYLGIDPSQSPRIYSEDQVDDWALLTHPDIVEGLWMLGRAIDPAIPCVINENSFPLLSHPTSGVIFGMARGTDTIALRLPEPEYSEMLAVPEYGAQYKYRDSTIYASDLGPDWVLLEPFARRNHELCQRAYDHASTLE